MIKGNDVCETIKSWIRNNKFFQDCFKNELRKAAAYEEAMKALELNIEPKSEQAFLLYEQVIMLNVDIIRLLNALGIKVSSLVEFNVIDDRMQPTNNLNDAKHLFEITIPEA